MNFSLNKKYFLTLWTILNNKFSSKFITRRFEKKISTIFTLNSFRQNTYFPLYKISFDSSSQGLEPGLIEMRKYNGFTVF